jgi:hypothetical protein
MTERENVVDIAAAREGKTVEAMAADYKQRSLQLLGDLVDLMREAETKSFVIEFAIQRDGVGRPFFVGPHISKRF